MSSSSTTRVPLASSTADTAVIGGGFAGLALATNLEQAGVDVIVLEAGDQPGGKVAGGHVGGCSLDVGADAWLERDDAIRGLVSSVGLDGEVMGVATTGVWVWNRRGLHRMPPTAVMGLPTDASAAREVLGPLGAARAAIERVFPSTAVDTDVSVGEFVSRRYGRAVADELVDPLLGGVYAGHVDRLSLLATIPALAEMARDSSVSAALRRRRSQAPTFRTLRGGLHQLPTALAARLGERVQLSAPVVELRRDGPGWEMRTAAGRRVTAERVVLACPTPVAAALVLAQDEAASVAMSATRFASVGVVAMAYPAASLSALPEGTGMLVSRSADRFIKAATWVSPKWGRPVGEEPLLVRASVGRIDDTRHKQMTDMEVIDAAAADLSDGVGLPPPLDAALVRWDDALPQYDVGHLDRVASIRSSLAESMPGVHLLGAGWDGVGLGPLATAAAALAGQLAA